MTDYSRSDALELQRGCGSAADWVVLHMSALVSQPDGDGFTACVLLHRSWI